MAKYDLIYKAELKINESLDIHGSESKYMKLFKRLIREEIQEYSNPMLREIIDDKDPLA